VKITDGNRSRTSPHLAATRGYALGISFRDRKKRKKTIELFGLTRSPGPAVFTSRCPCKARRFLEDRPELHRFTILAIYDSGPPRQFDYFDIGLYYAMSRAAADALVAAGDRRLRSLTVL
jgi:hypothetical protein